MNKNVFRRCNCPTCRYGRKRGWGKSIMEHSERAFRARFREDRDRILNGVLDPEDYDMQLFGVDYTD